MSRSDKNCHNCRYCTLRNFILACGTQRVNGYYVIKNVSSRQLCMCMLHGINIPNQYLYVCDDFEGFADGSGILKKVEES